MEIAPPRLPLRWKSQGDAAMIDGVLYTPTGVNQVAAIDPATGKTLWIFTPSPAEVGGGRPLTLSSRGLAYWTDGARKRLFHNTLDGRLLSIDAMTGGLIQPSAETVR